MEKISICIKEQIFPIEIIDSNWRGLLQRSKATKIKSKITFSKAINNISLKSKSHVQQSIKYDVAIIETEEWTHLKNWALGSTQNCYWRIYGSVLQLLYTLFRLL